MDCGYRRVNPRARDGRMLEAFLHSGTRRVNEAGHILRARGLETQFAGPVVHDVCCAGAEASGSCTPVSGKDSIMEADEEFAIPFEGRVVSAAQYEAHRVTVAADERGILLAGLRGEFTGKNSMDFFDCYRDALHGRRSGHSLSFEIAAQTTSPSSAKRATVVQLALPTV